MDYTNTIEQSTHTNYSGISSRTRALTIKGVRPSISSVVFDGEDGEIAVVVPEVGDKAFKVNLSLGSADSLHGFDGIHAGIKLELTDIVTGKRTKMPARVHFIYNGKEYFALPDSHFVLIPINAGIETHNIIMSSELFGAYGNIEDILGLKVTLVNFPFGTNVLYEDEFNSFSSVIKYIAVNSQRQLHTIDVDMIDNFLYAGDNLRLHVNIKSQLISGNCSTIICQNGGVELHVYKKTCGAYERRGALIELFGESVTHMLEVNEQNGGRFSLKTQNGAKGIYLLAMRYHDKSQYVSVFVK
jgi:hypothetical protein